MYDEKNYIGRYDSREVKQLEAFRELYDNDWNTIGFEMGRSANSVKDKARLLDTTKRKGIMRLVMCVRNKNSPLLPLIPPDYPPRTCAYQGMRNVSFFGKFCY